MSSDIVIKINFPINEPDKARIETNANQEALEEILSCWMREEMAKAVDLNEAKKTNI